ncbi:MAG TPA: hypothetical protein H9727_05465 [Candidatus Borkfalkia avistercoris]|uniref:Uncharacterized protein n=1 Tax=Candidatus Borkfalkia avistercoris TaxID=2838504 RepID=A0A9D2CZH7_9FIRM|nr:hypothetical protein [Candidatus Borkfalkia avistercoris]
MTIVYDDRDLVSAYKQKKRLFYIYLIVAVVYLALCIGCLIYYVNTPFNSSQQTAPKWIVWVSSCLFVIFSYIFLAIKYQRSRKYYKLISYLSVGLKAVNNSYFVRYDTPDLKDNVDYYVLIMSEWSKKKSEYLDRKIYCDKEKPCPQFKCGDKVRYLTQGNVIVGYEVVGHDDEFAENAEKASKKKL